MKRLFTIITSALLCVTMLVITPAQVVASAADNTGKYISEVKVGMGETSDEASKELLAEGYTILSDDKGNYADLNKDAGSTSLLSPTPRQKIVYLGYITTDNVKNAITDLAVMNTNGGYSIRDYEVLMDKYLNTQIKPFADRFIDTLIISRQGKRGYAPRKAPIRFKESSNPQRGSVCTQLESTGAIPREKLFLDSEPEAKRSHRRRRLALDGF